MTKNELKSIIKECLLEILTDGLGESLNEVKNKKKAVQTLVEKKEQEKKMLQKKREIADTISMATADPILRKVLSHTAETTLKEQLSHEPRKYVESMQEDSGDFMGAGSGTSAGDPGLDISKMFGSSAKNWETMAFSDKKRHG